MRIVFAGTPAIAVPSLQALSQSHQIVGVLTSPDSVSGRGRKEQISAVKAAALELGLTVLQPAKLDQTVRTAVADLRPDILVCVAYGFIFGPKFLALFPQGGVNLHPSLLPRWRGPSPLSAAILAGDQQTGITIQRLALEMDAGDILLQHSFALNGSETTNTLTEYCAHRGAELLMAALSGLANGTLNTQAQVPEAATFCHLIHKEDGLINWEFGASAIDRMVRAYDPWPRAFTHWNGETLYVLESHIVDSEQPHGQIGHVLRVDKSRGILVQTGKGLLALRRLQLQSKKGMDFLSFLNGARGFIGSALGA